MNETNTSRNLIIALAALLIVGAAGYFYATRDRSADDSLTSVSADEQAAAVDGDLLRTLGQLKKLKLDDSIFSDPVWQSLTDFGQTLVPQASGRPNPFAPLGSSAAAAASSEE